VSGMRWAIAIETLCDPRIQPATARRVHAYDPIGNKLAHPLDLGYAVIELQSWSDRTVDVRCRHCIEIAGDPDG
jgi:hypothetical protein